ncbi:methyltransferase domain-containing protein [Aureococcus anophagefferens]|nr:methyltransferase domain-containing protein [Aureococcus anophagefferens]
MCSYTKTINDKLCSVDPQSAFALLRNCSTRRLDFLASNAYPSDGAASYARFDVAVDEAARLALGAAGPGILSDTLASRRLRLPLSFGGGGLRSVFATVPAAFCGRLFAVASKLSAIAPKPTAAAFDGGETGDGFLAAPARWRSLLAGPSRLASELKSAWLKLTSERARAKEREKAAVRELRIDARKVKDDGTPRAASFFCVDRFVGFSLHDPRRTPRLLRARVGRGERVLLRHAEPLCAPLIGRTLPGGAKLDAYGAKLSTEHSVLNLESRRTDYHNAVLAQIHDSARQAGLPAQRAAGLLFSTGLTAAGRARLASERDAAVMLGDARDATAGDGAGVNRARSCPSPTSNGASRT